MPHTQRRSAPILGFLACFGPASAWAQVAEPWFTTSTGARAPTPQVESLDCRQMAEVLREIDRTGYRRGVATPENAADLALLRYENVLARHYYAECIGGASASSGAFSGGYDSADSAPARP